jgi:phosphate starvation-inducible PhoH-like protein
VSVTRRAAFEDNTVLVELYGVHDRNLARIDSALKCKLRARANQVEIAGEPDDVAAAHKALTSSTNG